MKAPWGLGLCLLALACSEGAPPLVYQVVPVERRDIVISAQAAGVVEPDVTVEVKSKASGEILEVLVDSGDLVERGTLLVRIDQRQPRNTLALGRAELEVAQARLANAEAEKRRAESLFNSKSIPETAYEQALLDHANAKAGVVRARVSVENAQIQMDDTEILAPIDGTVIAKNAERGQVISSPIQAVSGGTVLLKMADLNLVQVRTLVDETDIGKIAPGMAATVTVAAYPSRPFEGDVLKIEPQAETQQNVTMFPVLVRIENREGLLRPGMNCEVEVHVGSRMNVLAIPNVALRIPRDLSSAAQVLGLSKDLVREQLRSAVGQEYASSANSSTVGAPASAPATDESGNGETVTTPDGREVSIRRAAGGSGSPGQHGGPRVGVRDSSFVFGGSYVVFALKDGVPSAVRVRIGLTDLDYSEVVEGLSESDSVLLLPSTHLIEAQDRFRQRIDRMTGRGSLPGTRSSGRQ